MSDYQLDALGWYQFERMCQALLRSRHGAALEAWGGSQDLGRDAYSDGPLNYPHKDVSEPGPFLFQVKFVSAANAAGAKSAPALLRAVRLEASQILDRIADEVWVQPRFYTLLTNVPLNASLRDDVKTILGPVMPGSQILINGAKDIDSMLDSDPGIRLSYPQVLGLRDLEALLTRAVARPIVQRSSFSLEEARRLAPVYVPTEAYNQAISLLARSGFAVLLGPPEMGKTATARMITLAKHCAGWEAYECRNPNDLFTAYARWRPQVFLADDAFGSTEYRPELAEEWAADLGRIIDLADESHWVLWTSRPAPLRQGLRQLHLQGSASKFPSPGEVEVDAAQLSVTEKSLILYRHAKAQHLSTDGTKLIRRFALQFLYTASVSGLVLALSSAGGATGDRTLPLLRTEADWKALGIRISSIIPDLGSLEQLSLLRGLVSALTVYPFIPGSELSGHFRDVSMVAMDGLRQCWDAEQTVPDLAMLQSYFRLAEMIHALVPCPRLHPTWGQHVEAARRPMSNSVVKSFGRLTQLAALIEREEPRFLRVIGFPDSMGDLIERMVRQIEEELQTLPERDPDEEEEVSDDSVEEGSSEMRPVEPSLDEARESEWLEEVITLLKTWARLAGTPAPELEALLRAARWEWGVRETRSSRSWQGGHHATPALGGFYPPPARGEAGGGFDLDQFFSDL